MELIEYFLPRHFLRLYQKVGPLQEPLAFGSPSPSEYLPRSCPSRRSREKAGPKMEDRALLPLDQLPACSVASACRRARPAPPGRIEVAGHLTLYQALAL